MTPRSGDDWISAELGEFERRLRRTSIGQRPQYMHQRARWLTQQGDLEGAREMLDRALAVPEIWSVYEKIIRTELAYLELMSGNAVKAEAIYRHILTEWPGQGGADGAAEIELAEILIDRNSVDEAVELLNSWLAREEENAFNVSLFRYAVCAVRIAEIRNDPVRARQWATRALDAAKRPDEFPRHPGVGSARPDRGLLEWLRRAAGLAGD